MNRVWDYCGFVIWFVGLGYIVVWLIGVFDYPVLPPALHLIGLASATFVAARVLALAIMRWRVPMAVGLPVAQEASNAPREPAPPLPTVKPRRNFGLRGAPD